MSKFAETSREVPSNMPDQKQMSRAVVPTGYKIIIGSLLLLLVIVSLLSLQQVNLLQLQNGHLVSYSSNLDQQYREINKIATLGETQVLADHMAFQWSGITKPPDLSWHSFQYSGYLHMTWNSTAILSLQVSQFGLNITTPGRLNGNFNIPLSSQEPFSASFLTVATCPSECQATYSATYHY